VEVSVMRRAFDVKFARQQFPALKNATDILMDNAGGSQVVKHCINRINHMLSHSNVQLDAPYELSKLTTDRVLSGFTAAQHLVNARSHSEIVLGSSTTQLMYNLSYAMLTGEGTASGKPMIGSGDEIIVTNVDHEANVGCWVKMARAAGATVKFWEFEKGFQGDYVGLNLETLSGLLTERTKLVCFTHCSNILGTITPVKEIGDLVRSKVCCF
jgi:selenocysteine lyase/cysteine desulfurase